MKIAIIGSGISGMTCGHLLAQSYDIHLFEAENRLGGHTHTHEITVKSGTYNVDSGFIVFNDKNYPNFLKLMKKLDVSFLPSSMSFSVKAPAQNLEYNGTTVNSLFCQRMNLFRPRFYRMIKDIIRFNKEATNYFLNSPDLDREEKTLEAYLKENKYSEEFTEHYIMPMGAAIWSASRQEMRSFPLHFFCRFFHHHGMLSIDQRPQWQVIKGGSKSYIPHLTKNFSANIHLDSPVDAVIRKDNHLELHAKGNIHQFDQVIFATHADETMKILKSPTPDEEKVMGGFSYRPNDILLHTDTSILPKSKLGHASWNYYIPKQEKERVAVTYHMNILQSIKSPEKFLVSLNMDEYVDPKKVIKAISYSHPVYNLSAVKSQSQWELISGKDRVHFCGAYWGNGFHEDGVKSALKVTESLGRSL